MLKELWPRIFWLVALLPLVALMSCQPARPVTAASAWLPSDSPTRVDFPLTTSTQSYVFNTRPDAETTLTVYTLSPGLTYAAEVRDARGKVVATLNGGPLNVASLTLAPSTELYEVRVQTDSGSAPGAVLLTVGGALPPAQAPLAATGGTGTTAVNPAPAYQPVNTVSSASGVCSVSSSVGSSINIRSGPGLNYGVIGALASGEARAVSGQSDNGWFQVDAGGQTGWVSGSVTTLSGACGGLPWIPAAALVPTPTPPPAFPAAPLDAGVFSLIVDRFSAGSFSDSLSYPDGDRSDLIQLTIANFSAQPPDNYGEFMLTLVCTGQGIEYIRWGLPESPSFVCGSAFSLPFMLGAHQQMFAVLLPDGSPPSMVAYTLLVARR